MKILHSTLDPSAAAKSLSIRSRNNASVTKQSGVLLFATGWRQSSQSVVSGITFFRDNRFQHF